MAGTTGRIMTDFSRIVAEVENIAPSLVGALTTPFAGVVTGLLGKCFGVEFKDIVPSANDITKVVEAMRSDPETLFKLKQFEFENEKFLQEINSRNYLASIDDRKSARGREQSLHDWVPTILAIGFLVNYALIQAYCVTHSSPTSDLISARFQDILLMIISYYFGSSHLMK